MRILNQILGSVIASVFFAIVAFISSSCSAQSGEDLKFPYQALVLHDDATVHSGPGQVHYATQKLKQGKAVEVYRHDPGGWCAIRPPNSSFSLIPESTLELVEEGIGRISEDGTQAWVGTELGPVEKPLWQVKLQMGEQVEVLGQVSWPDPEGHSIIWYQVSPPAGEFRWIRMSDIQLPVTAVQSAAPTQQTVASSPPVRSETVRSLHDILPQSPELDSSTISTESVYGLQGGVKQAALQTERAYPDNFSADIVNRGWRQASRPIRATNSETDDSLDRGFNNGSSNAFRDQAGFADRGGFEKFSQPNQTIAYPNQPIRVANADITPPKLALDMNAARDSLANSANAGFSLNGALPNSPSSSGDLELQLTQEMLKDPSQWRLEDLEMAANTIYRTTQNPLERSLAEKYLAKISNCKDIRSGYRSDNRPGLSSPGTGSTQPIGTGIDHDIENGTQYDAHGWLTELIRDGGNSQSTYALQDDNGKITHHVSPEPGMNIHRFLKSKVGIVGRRGYHSQLKLDHVTATRIVELEKPRSSLVR